LTVAGTFWEATLAAHVQDGVPIFEPRSVHAAEPILTTIGPLPVEL
jgi:hypothetical protein